MRVAQRLLLTIGFVFCTYPLSTQADDKPLSAKRATISADDTPTEKATTATSKSDTAEKFLTDKGLKKENKRFLLDETAAVDKYKSVKTLYDDYQKAMMKASAIANYDENLAMIQMQQKNLAAEASALQNQINRANSGVNRRIRGMVNQQLTPYRHEETMLKNQANQMTQQYNAMKGKGPSANDRKAAPLQLDLAYRAYADAAKELESLVTPLMTQYHELALDPKIVDALAQLHLESPVNYKLGPSDDLRAAAKLVKDLKLAPKHGKTLTKTKSPAKTTEKP